MDAAWKPDAQADETMVQRDSETYKVIHSGKGKEGAM